MKPHPFAVAVLLAGGCLFAFGQPATPRAQPAPAAQTDLLKSFGANVRPGDLVAMEKFLSMPPEKIRAVVATLNKIAEMPENKRAELCARVKALRMMNEERRRNLFYEFRHTSPRDRDMVKRYVDALSPEARKEMRERFFNAKLGGPERVEGHRHLLEMAKAAGIQPNETLSDVVGSDIPPNLKGRGARKPEALPPPPCAEAPCTPPCPPTNPAPASAS